MKTIRLSLALAASLLAFSAVAGERPHHSGPAPGPVFKQDQWQNQWQWQKQNQWQNTNVENKNVFNPSNNNNHNKNVFVPKNENHNNNHYNPTNTFNPNNSDTTQINNDVKSRSRSRSDSRSTSSASNGDQSLTYNESRQRLQAPSVYGQFSSGATAPCERNPLGAGASFPGLGALFQIPMSSDRCWEERKATLGLEYRARGINISDNALIAILAGDDVRTAVQNNPYVAEERIQVRRSYSTTRKAQYRRVRAPQAAPCNC